MPLKKRLLYLLIAWLPAGLIYAATGAVKGNPWIVPELFIDSLIPFSSSGIWLYLMFYVYIPYTFLSTNESNIKILTSSFVASACLSGIIFVLFPSSIRFPDFEINGISAWLLNFVSEHDTEQNCFPSLHGSLITLCTIANWNRAKTTRSYGCALLTLLMYYSILQVRRHVFIDLAAGITLAFLVWYFCVWIFNQLKERAALA